MLELFPEGFEEAERSETTELAVYTDSVGATRLWREFGEYSWSEIPEDWQHRWREFHKPARIGRLWIGPPWEKIPDDAVAVVIDPGRAFGTGAHPTTRLCLELLQQLASEGTSLLDVGTGSGVLAIAAVKLGYSPVVAVDHDNITVETAIENAKVNGVDIDVRLVEALEEPLPAADVAIANVSATIAEALAPRLRVGRLVVSGYFDTESPALPGYDLVERRTLDGWAADLWLPSGAPRA
jgi:ribosomal protein L11 methyltransferase